MPVDIVALDYDWSFELCRADDDDHEHEEPQPLGPDGFLYYVRFQRAGQTTTPTWVDSSGQSTIEAAMKTAHSRVPSAITWRA